MLWLEINLMWFIKCSLIHNRRQTAAFDSEIFSRRLKKKKEKEKSTVRREKHNLTAVLVAFVLGIITRTYLEKFPLKTGFWRWCLDASLGQRRSLLLSAVFNRAEDILWSIFRQGLRERILKCFLFFGFHAAPFFSFESFLTLSGESLRSTLQFRKKK